LSDTIGRITIPDLVSSGLTFPLKSDFGFGFTQDQPIVTHRFGDLDTKCEQRYKVGIGPRKHAFKRANLSLRDRNNLATFWETIRGSLETFTYNVPNADQTTTPKTVTWEQAPLSFEYLQHACRVGFNFLEAPGSATSYTVASTCTRFPSTTLASSLTGQVQELIPLIHIRVRESAVPDIYLSDRRCIVGGQLYLPRVLGLGEPGSDVLLSQDINGTADGVKFTLGNADGVMTALANDTDLKFATIDLCFYDVTTGILLQLWKGNIQNFTIDGSPHFTIQASDGAYQTTLAYPNAIISRQCRATFNDGILCPWSTAGGIGDSTKCDYYWNSVNGCVSHGMQRYFRGIPILPQSVNIKLKSWIAFTRPPSRV
jgi:hypothetical protein